MKRNQAQLEQGSSGFSVVLDSENGNRHSNCSTSRRKMRIVSRKCCAHKEAVVVPLSSPAQALPPTTLIEGNSEPIKSAINGRNTSDTLTSPPTTPGVTEPEELLVGQPDINDDTQMGTGGQLSNGFRSRYLITTTLSLSDNSECDSSLYSRRSSSSCSSHSSFMSHSPSDSYEEGKKRKTFVSMVVGGRCSLADQAIKRENSCSESNESDVDLVCIDYTRTSRYPEKKKRVFSYPEYERSLLLEAASKMLNGDAQRQQQHLLKVEEERQKLYHEASNSGSSCSSNPFSTSHSFIPKEKDDEDR